MRALITGVGGFVGPYLTRHLLEQGYEVAGTFVGARPDLPGVSLTEADVRSAEAVRRAVAAAQPDEVYHLAALSRPAEGRLADYYEVNFLGALHLLEAVRAEAPEAAVLLVGSAYAYGPVPAERQPISESEPLRPVGHYAVSKAAADLLGGSYARQGLRVVRARPFNHTGVGQSPDIVVPAVARQVARIRRGLQPPRLVLGSLEPVRDVADVRDVVRAYRLLLARGRPGEAYNVCAGRGWTVGELARLLLECGGVAAEIVSQPERRRAAEIPSLVGDPAKIRAEVGWEAEMPLRDTLRAVLAHEEGRLALLNGAPEEPRP